MLQFSSSPFPNATNLYTSFAGKTAHFFLNEVLDKINGLKRDGIINIDKELTMNSVTTVTLDNMDSALDSTLDSAVPLDTLTRSDTIEGKVENIFSHKSDKNGSTL